MNAGEDRPLKILIIEDNPADVHLIREALLERQINFTLQVIDDGESAFQFFGETAGQRVADIVLLDLNLPKISGDAILSRIRQNPALQDVPTVVLTSSDSPKDRNQAERLGATAYVRKPSNLDEFFAIGGLVQQLTGR
jgi:chemotaxis family two-component system response regulator Rcp1